MSFLSRDSAKDVKLGEILDFQKVPLVIYCNIWHQSRFHAPKISLFFPPDGTRLETCERNSVFNFIFGEQ